MSNPAYHDDVIETGDVGRARELLQGNSCPSVMQLVRACELGHTPLVRLVLEDVRRALPLKAHVLQLVKFDLMVDGMVKTGSTQLLSLAIDCGFPLRETQLVLAALDGPMFDLLLAHKHLMGDMTQRVSEDLARAGHVEALCKLKAAGYPMFNPLRGMSSECIALLMN